MAETCSGQCQKENLNIEPLIDNDAGHFQGSFISEFNVPRWIVHLKKD